MEITEQQIEEFAEKALIELYKFQHPATRARDSILEGASQEDRLKAILFLTNRTGLCVLKQETFQLGRTEYCISLSELGLMVMSKHKSFAKYKESVKEKEKREKRIYIWAITAGIAGIVGAAVGLINIGMSLQEHIPKSKSKTEQTEQTPKMEAVEYPHNQTPVDGSKNASTLDSSFKDLNVMKALQNQTEIAE